MLRYWRKKRKRGFLPWAPWREWKEVRNKAGIRSKPKRNV